mmetsp:Transcript_34612/g.64485  ORF Transcript_34612/g.64485 Transcript_34612/m.64485 type:complete len:205 (+) Transcript_34612:70-684(+)
MFPRKTTGRSSNLPAKTCREIAIFKFWILGSSLVLVSGFTHTWSMATHTPACQDVRCNKVLEARSWCTGLLQNPVAKIGFQGRRERSTRASRRRQGRREQDCEGEQKPGSLFCSASWVHRPGGSYFQSARARHRVVPVVTKCQTLTLYVKGKDKRCDTIAASDHPEPDWGGTNAMEERVDASTEDEVRRVVCKLLPLPEEDTDA